MTQYAEGRFEGVRKTAIYYQSWTPEMTRATIVIVHGYSEHSGRYRHVAAALNRQGYAVWALDLRGHGHSEGLRAHVERFDDFIEDLALLVSLARVAAPQMPLFVLGHSMGGLIAVLYALAHPAVPAGLILTGPAVKVDQLASPLLVALARLLSSITPTLGVVRTTNRSISRDAQVVAAVDADPLCYHGSIRARFGYETLRATQSVLPRAGSLKLPLLVLQGEADQVIPASGVQQFFAAVGSADKTLLLYPDLYHEVLNEPEREQALADMLAWLGGRVGSGEAPSPQHYEEVNRIAMAE